MDDDIVIKARDISKKYCKKLKRSMVYGINDISRNLLGFSSYPDRLRKDEFWAVKKVSFDLKKGETLGIIGQNGSGKTTVLKMINGIFWPDHGKISIQGKVGALIAAGAGFHPLLTGRENIYVNAAIFGMGRKQIAQKFDDIVHFADIGDFIDTPVKYYSTGMNVRLGFAIAMNCNPDIMLIDEVLSVGDINFQEKSLRAMTEFIRDKNKAQVFVSHNLSLINSICDKVLLLDKGICRGYGDFEDVYPEYLKYMNSSEIPPSGKVAGSSPVGKGHVTFLGIDKSKKIVTYEIFLESDYHDAKPQIIIYRKRDGLLITGISGDAKDFKKGRYVIEMQIPFEQLYTDIYILDCQLRYDRMNNPIVSSRVDNMTLGKDVPLTVDGLMKLKAQKIKVLRK